MAKSNNFNIVMIGLMGTRWLANRLLHAILEKKGFEVHTIFLREDYEMGAPIDECEYKHVVQILNELAPGLVTINLTSFYVNDAKSLTGRIKEQFDVPVLWGGIHPSLEPEACLEYADMVCIGEGEETLPEIASSIQRGDGRTDIENVMFKKDGNIIRNSNRALLDGEKLNSMPFPDFSDKNKYYIVGGKLHRENNPSPYYKYEYHILTGRGCPFLCTYCASHKISKMGLGKMLRRRTPENVMEELRFAIKNSPKIRKINFWDDIFTYDLKWLKEFSDLYVREIRIPFFCYVHPQLIDEEKVGMLKQMGIQDIAIGFQHGAVRIRKGYFERHETDDTILEAISLLHHHKIKIHLDMIATPFDNEKDKYENLDLLLKLPKPFNLYTHTLTFFPGYKITDRALSEKLITENDIVGENFRTTIGASKNEIMANPWLCYQSLMGKKYIPNRFIKYLIRAKYHSNHFRALRFMSSLELTWDRISDFYEHNIELLKNMEFKYFLSMFRFGKLLFK